MTKCISLLLLAAFLVYAISGCATGPLPTGVPSTTLQVSPTAAGVQEALVVFEFSEVDSGGKAVAFHSITFLDTDDHSFGEVAFGTPEAYDLLGDGWLETEESPEIGTIQWAGGASKRASMHLAIPDGTEGLLLKITSVVDGLWMDVKMDGRLASTLRVD